MAKGFMYLAVVMDWYSRYVLSWELPNSMESSFCVEVLQRALDKYGVSQIFNSDQGSQFTSNRTSNLLGFLVCESKNLIREMEVVSKAIIEQ